MKSSDGLDCISFTSWSIRFTAGFFRLYFSAILIREIFKKNKTKIKNPHRIRKNSIWRLQDPSKRRLDAESDPKQRLIQFPTKNIDQTQIGVGNFFFPPNIYREIVGQRSMTWFLADDGEIDGWDFVLLEGVMCRPIIGYGRSRKLLIGWKDCALAALWVVDYWKDFYVRRCWKCLDKTTPMA